MPIALILGTATPAPLRLLHYDPAGLAGRAGCVSVRAAPCDAPTGGGPDAPAAPVPAATVPAAPAPVAAAAPPVTPRAAPPIAPGWGLRLLVSIPQQRLYVYDGAGLVTTSPVSTGKRGHATPLGTFRILQKQVHHRSNRYSNAPMPFMQRLTMSGIALHAGHLPGYPASHGCIRLPWAFAKRLYGLTTYATTVTVTRARPVPAAKFAQAGRRRWKNRALALAAEPAAAWSPAAR